MDSSNLRNNLVSSCVEVYEASGNATKEVIYGVFSGNARDVHFVHTRSIWLVLLHSPEAVDHVLRNANPLMYSGYNLQVFRCMAPTDIPQEWVRHVQVAADDQHFKIGFDQQGLEPFNYGDRAGAQGDPHNVAFPEHFMTYPHQLVQHGHPQMGPYSRGATPSPPVGLQPVRRGSFNYLDEGRQGENTLGFPQWQQQQGVHYMPSPFGNLPSPQPPPVGQFGQIPLLGYSESGPDGRMMYPPNYNMLPYTGEKQEEQIVEKSKRDREGKKRKQPKSSATTKSDKTKTSEKIKVSKLPASVTKKTLRTFFENRKLSGGGAIESIDHRKDKREAIITFEDSSVVKRILQKLPLCLEEKQVCVELYIADSKDNKEDGTIGEEPKRSCVIQVRGMKDTTTADAIELYFESKKAVGEELLDDVEVEITENGSVALVKYGREEDMRRVLRRQHIVDGVPLEVKEYIPAKLPTLSDNRVLLSGVSSSTTKDGLVNFLEAKANASPSDILYADEKGVVMVTFEEQPDFQKLKEACKIKAVDGNFLQMSRVPVSNCVLVTGISSSTTEDTLQLYFENERRSGGGDVEKIEYDPEEGTCFVFFEDHRVADRVCARRHKIDDQVLSLKINNQITGFSSDKDAAFEFPEPFIVTPVAEHKINFLLNSEKNRMSMEERLTNAYAKVVWPESHKGVLKIACTLTTSIKDYRKLAKTWRKDTDKTLLEYLDTLLVVNFKVLQEVWQEIMTILNRKNIQNPDDVVVVVKKEIYEIEVVGHSNLVSEMAEEIKRDLKSVEEEVNRQKNHVTEKVDLKRCQILLLNRLQFLEYLQSKYKGLKITSDLNQSQITILGTKEEVKQAKVGVLEKVNEIVIFNTGRFSKRKYRLLQNCEVEDYVWHKMKDCGISASWEMEQESLKLYTVNRDAASAAGDILKQVIVTLDIPVEERSKYVLSNGMLENEIERIKQTHVQYAIDIECDVEHNAIMLCSTEVDKGVVEKLIYKFLDDNRILKSKVQLEDVETKILNHPQMKAQVSYIAKSLQAERVQIETDNFEIVVKGTSVGVKKAEQQIIALIQNLVNRKHKIQKPGIVVLMESSEGQDKLRRVERMKNVIIVPDNDYNLTEECLRPAHIWGENGQEIARYDTERYQIIVILGDITELEIGVLVNPANENLNPGGGLAKVIFDKGGEDLWHECREHISRNRRLKEGEVLFGLPGKLKCKMIAHAVSPVWKGGRKGEKMNLQTLVYACLEKCNEGRLQSVAIPAIGAGGSGVPIEVTIKAIMSSIKTFFTNVKHCNLKHVILCDNKPDVVSLFKRGLKDEFGESQVIDSCSDKEMEQCSSRNTSQLSFHGEENNADLGDHEFALPVESDFDGNIKVEVVEGDMAKQEVDVIVNTKGFMSNSLLKNARKDLQAELSKKYPKGKRYGEVEVTEGFKLNCRYIYHGELPVWKEEKSPKDFAVLQTFMTKCLEIADGMKLKSMAFPAMGTGKQKYPKAEVAREMFALVSRFSGDHPQSSLEIVRFVINEKSKGVWQAFQYAKDNRSKPLTSNAVKKANERSVHTKTAGKCTTHNLQYSQDIGRLTLKIYLGDITLAEVDAVVNSTNAEFDLTRGAVAQAIKTSGGSDLEKQIVLKQREMKKKGVVVTTCGASLPCKFVVHVNTEDRSNSWKSKILAVLQEVEDSGNIKSLAFPALGTGLVGGVTVGEATIDVCDALMEFQQLSKSIEDLQEVHIVLYHEDALRNCLYAAKKWFEQIKSVKLKEWFKQLFGFEGSKEIQGWNPKTERKLLVQASYPVIVYGDSYDDVDDAIRKLNAAFGETSEHKSFDDDILKEFNKRQVKAIHKLQTIFDVEIQLERSLGRLHIHGKHDDIVQVSEEIHKLLRKAVTEKQLEKEAQLIADMVNDWYYVNEDTEDNIEPYPPNINLILEKAYRRQDKNVHFVDNEGNQYIADLVKLVAYCENNPQSCMKIQRKGKMEEPQFDVPSNWTEMTDAENLKVVPLNPKDKEFQNIVSEFQKTVGNPRNVTEVERIQNRTLYQQYIAKRALMEKENATGTQNERLLWHGTSPEAVDSINAYGFNRSYCGKNATIYGSGVYFAVQSFFSAQNTYSRADGDGNKRVYYCRVLTGEFTQGQKDIKVPPNKPNAPAHVLFDSVVDKLENPGMFVIFNDTHAYPEYLLTFN